MSKTDNLNISVKRDDSIRSTIYSVPLGLDLKQRVALVKNRASNVSQLKQCLVGDFDLIESIPLYSKSSAVQKLFDAIKGWGVIKYLHKSPELVASIVEQITKVAVEEENGIQSQAAECACKILENLVHSFKEKMLDECQVEALFDVEGDRLGLENVVVSDEEYEKMKSQSKTMAIDQVKKQVGEKVFSEWIEGSAAQNLKESAEAWNKLSSVFGDLGNVLGRGFDLTTGILQSQGWQNIKRLNELVERIPELQELLELIGRMRLANAEQEPDKTIMEAVFETIDKTVYEPIETKVDYIPEEICGITSGDSIERMIASEYTLLSSKKRILRLLFHAKRIERSLLQYELLGTDIDFGSREGTENLEVQKPAQSRTKLGPIIICLDTSGSMHGVPEQVCKALALQAIKIAQRDKRQLLLINWSGLGNCVAEELSLSSAGLNTLLRLLLSSFTGGSDVYAPVQMALAQLRKTEGSWNKADILMVSDGEWTIPQGILTDLQKAREEHRVKFHGVLVGGHGRVNSLKGAHGRVNSLKLMCDEGCFHTFSSWDAFGGC
jgi:uncharacterized protein with von Willebrand factor type A (vWA) domain